MTTEYYQIPSQQGLLPLASGDSADPWLAAATNSLSISDSWSANKGKQISSPPSLFEPGDAEASVSWKNVVPLQYSAKAASAEVKAPVAPKQFNSTTSKIDAWSVVVDSNALALKQPNKPSKQAKQTNNKQQTKQANKQVKSTALVAEEKPLEDELSHQNRYKTELCKSYTETGNCRYGTKCQFAHGKEEIRPILRHPKYKTEICKTFHTTGTCPYGMRCRFIHTRSKEESIMTVALQVEEEEEDVDDDETANAPPGIPMPQWSKSWNMSMSPAPSKVLRHAAVAAPEPAF
eukprot:Phypoly_transcript_10707.p1 GENE.Phypoly_transcript_10707~~Phypoly_transcript_10707.p1  ORF type:complete len:341 (+),score=73.09 Phypoly_transcript_10707:152-1024(+)